MSEALVYLASASPRRRELLQQIGVPFQVLAVAVDESVRPGEAPATYVTRLAHAKAQAAWHGRGQENRGVVLAADTAVVQGGRIFGKPVDREDALRMLQELSGRTHGVLTAVAVLTAAGLASRLSQSEVRFRTISAPEAQSYWDTGESRDKAGAYAIQGYAAVFVAELRGSYSGVMGLPLFETAELLELAGVPRWL
jgi:septum formation protein